MPHPTQDRPDDVRLVAVAEPVEGAFTVLMPEGWTNHAHLQREHGLNRVIASATRPDGGAMIHLGDSRLPTFMQPGTIDPMLLAFQPQVRIQPFTPADRFGLDFVHQMFGRAPGFRVLGAGPSPMMERICSTIRAKHPHAAITAAAVVFENAALGRPLLCRLQVATMGLGPGWVVDLAIASVADPAELERVDRLALRMLESRQSHPGWAAAQQRLHEQRMAMGDQQIRHTEAMTNLQAQGHARRMHDIHAFGHANTMAHDRRMASHDAMHQSWMAGQAADDAMQQSRINGIREEHTAVGPDGTTYQVDIHHERYYVNKRDNTYIGTGAVTERQDLGRTHGVDPDDYEEIRVVR